MTDAAPPTEKPADQPAPAEKPAATPPADKPADQPAPAEKPEAEPEVKAEDQWTPYEIKAPDGVKVDEGSLKDFTTFANELKIPKDKAEAFSHQFARKQLEAVQNQVATWRTESEADKEIGGPNYEENVGVAKKALKKFGGDEVLEVLEKTGLGNHKAIIRTFLRVGKAMSDDVVITQNAGTPKAEPNFTSALMSVASANKQKGS